MQSATDKDLSLLRLLSPEVLVHPHVLYRALREHDPVHWDPYMHAWVVTTYREAVQVLSDFSSERIPSVADLERLGLNVMSPFSDMMRMQMMFMDGAKVAFPLLLRRLVNPQLMDSTLAWRQNAGLRGLTRLPIAFDA